MKLDRFDWANEYKNFRWNEVIFSDECSVWLSSKIGKVWSKKGNECRYFKPTHTPKVHVWAAIWRKGVVGY